MKIKECINLYIIHIIYLYLRLNCLFGRDVRIIICYFWVDDFIA